MNYQHQIQKNNYKENTDSKIIIVLITMYMSSVLLFSTHTDLNIISQVLFLLAFGGCSLYMMMHNKNLKIDRFLIILAFFIIFCFLSVIWAEDKNASISKIITLSQLFLMSLVLFSYISNYNNINKIINGFIIASILCSLMVIGYYGIGEYIRLMIEGVRLGGPINNVNAIGLYTSTGAIMCFYFAYNKGQKWYYLIMALPFLVAMGTGSRKVMALLVIAIIMLVFMQYKNNANIFGFMRLIVVFAAIVIILFVMSNMEIFGTMFSRFEKMFSETNRDTSTELRQSMIEVGWSYFKNHPYTGIGIGNTFIIAKENLNYETYLHNNYIELLASVGILGTILYYAIYAYLVANLYKITAYTGDDISALMLVIMVSFLAMDFGLVSYYEKMTYIYFTMAAATVSIGKQKILEEADNDDFKQIEKSI